MADIANQLPANLTPEIRAEICQAFDKWEQAKANFRYANEVVNAYLKVYQLMRQHVDPYWT